MRTESCLNQDIAELLPWYVNETLGDEERRRVERHIGGCHACRREVEILRRTAASVQADAPIPQSDLYARTLWMLEPRGLTGVRHVLGQWLFPIPTYARVALAAQFAVIVVLAGFLVSREPFTTLSGPREVPGPSVRVQVIFSEKATTGQVQEVLTSLGAKIVDGPTSAGVYYVDIPIGLSGGVKTGEEALRRLRGIPIVEFVEVVGRKP